MTAEIVQAFDRSDESSYGLSMSRYTSTPPGWPPHYSFVLGWDDPLGSFFALVIDATPGQDEHGIIAAIGSEPPHFSDPDELLRVVNGRIGDRLPPVRLTGDLRRALVEEGSTERPIIRSLTLTSPEEPPAPDPAPPVRPSTALGTHIGYMNVDELQEVLNALAGQYVRLEKLYLARTAKGLSEHNDEDTKLIRHSLGSVGSVCHLMNAMVQTDALVAREAIQPFEPISAEAARVLQAHAPAETVH